jgi:alkaline phosphatase D
MKVNPLTVGPIIGYTTQTSVRVWGRGGLDMGSGEADRCFGVARISLRRNKYRKPILFKMKAEFDRTGVVDFEDLDPGISYRVQMGYFFADSEPEALTADLGLDWDEASEGEVTTVPSNPASPASFILGSCRYILRFGRTALFDQRGDKTFRSVINQLNAGIRTDLMVMCGDQIYADDLNFLFPDQHLSEFHERYALVYSQPYIRQLMSRVPTYMTLDDHEIMNDWTQDKFKEFADRFVNAMHAYHSYQVVHGPAFQATETPDESAIPRRLWYQFRHGNSSFFVMDTRTERFKELDPPEMVSGEQMGALKEWLTANEQTIKFVVSSVPFFPDTRMISKDRWSGFTLQRTEILDFIRHHQVRRVVFLSGDIHASGSAQLVCQADPSFRVTSIISSPFYWPYPHLNDSHIQKTGILATSEGVDYQLDNAGTFFGTDNFTRVTATSLDQLQVQVFGRKGALLADRMLNT